MTLSLANISLSDAANWAQVASVPLAILLWYFTKEKAAKFWKKWQRVIFSLLSIAFVIGLFRLSWLYWLSKPVQTHTWAMIGLYLLGVATPLAFLAIRFLKKDVETTPHWSEYKTDTFFGVTWRWRYLDNDFDEDSFTAICPKCQCLLDVREDYQRAFNFVPVTFACSHCGYTSPSDYDRPETRRRLMLQVDRLLRSGEYVQRMRSLNPPKEATPS